MERRGSKSEGSGFLFGVFVFGNTPGHMLVTAASELHGGYYINPYISTMAKPFGILVVTGLFLSMTATTSTESTCATFEEDVTMLSGYDYSSVNYLSVEPVYYADVFIPEVIVDHDFVIVPEMIVNHGSHLPEIEPRCNSPGNY